MNFCAALGLLLGVEVVEVAEELVEPVVGRQMLVVIAEMVLAELAGRVALGLHDIGDRGHPVRDAVRVSRHADGQQAGTERLLAEDERRTTRGTALLPIGVGEHRAFIRDAVDVRRLVAHQSSGVGADLWDADVVAEDHEDVRFFVRTECGARCREGRKDGRRELRKAQREFWQFCFHGLCSLKRLNSSG